MTAENPYLKLEENMEKYFGFLTEYGFSSLNHEQAFLKSFFTCSNNTVTLSFETHGYGRLVWLNINKNGFRQLEPDNQIIEKILASNEALFDELIMKPFIEKRELPAQKKEELKIAIEGLLDPWLAEMSQIIKRNISVLKGM